MSQTEAIAHKKKKKNILQSSVAATKKKLFVNLKIKKRLGKVITLNVERRILSGI